MISYEIEHFFYHYFIQTYDDGHYFVSSIGCILFKPTSHNYY